MHNTIKHKASSQHLELARILIWWLRLKFQAPLTLPFLCPPSTYNHQSVHKASPQILCWLGDIDLSWNQVLIGQHLGPWPISYALLIKAQWLVSLPLADASPTSVKYLFFVKTPPPPLYVCLLLCCNCVAKVHLVKVRMQKHFCQSIYVSINLNWNHTFISSKFQAM